jgi:diacylglycerol kinase (ATP)
MPKHRLKLIVNPNADTGNAWRWARDLRPVADEFGGADWSGTVYPGHAIELAHEAAEEGYELVVAAGGDGTVHEVVNGLMQAPPDRRPHLGVVPLGSGNDFAHSIGMDTRPGFALRQVLTGSPLAVDIMRLCDGLGRCEYVDNTVGIGFDATVVIGSRNVRFVTGFLIYLVSVLQTIALNHEAAHLQVKTDQEAWQEDTLMLVLCNGPREGGGFLVAPQARNTDGILDYAGVRRVSRPMMLRLLPEVMRGTHARFPQVRTGQFRKLELESDRPLYIHTDGEIYAGFGMDVRRLTLELIPGGLVVVR